MIWLIISILLAASVIWLAFIVKKEKSNQKEMRNDHFQELAAMKELQKASLETAATKFDEDVIRLSESYKREIEKLMIENEDIRRNYRNQGEIITHQILENFKSNLIRDRILTPDEMILLPNIFIPDMNGNTVQIDHIVLLPTGIYVIESIDWKGHIVLGLTEKSSHRFAFLVELLNSEAEETLLFDKDDAGSLTVKTHDNPIGQVQQNAFILSGYLKRQNLDAWINTILFFNEEEKDVHDWSDNSVVKRFTNKEQLHKYFINELTSKNRIYGAFQLKNIKDLIESAHYL